MVSGVSRAIAEQAAGIVREAGGQAVIQTAGDAPEVDDESGLRLGWGTVGLALAALVCAAAPRPSSSETPGP